MPVLTPLRTPMLHMVVLQFVVMKYWYLLHIHFDSCYFLKAEISPF